MKKNMIYLLGALVALVLPGNALATSEENADYTFAATVNSASDGSYVVYHHRQALDASYPLSLCDTAFGTGTLNDSVFVNANTYVGFTADHLVDTIASLSANDTVHFYYTRNSYDITWNLNGGTIGGVVNPVSTMLFDDTISYPTPDPRPGYTFVGWSPILTTVPAANITIDAIFTRKDYPLTWSHTDTVVAYNGTDRMSDITATYVDDDSNTVNAILTILNASGNTVAIASRVGVYGIYAAPVDTNYHLVGTLSTTLTIVPASVAISGVQVQEVKLDDGTADATVIDMGSPAPVFGSDDLQVYTTAAYDNATAGENKTITAHFTLMGADKANYALANASQAVTASGVIVPVINPDPSQGDNGTGISVNADGYCSGDASGIRYFLTSGAPDQYKLVFDQTGHANGFSDVLWNSITTTGTVDITIPANATSQSYNATLTLRNSNYPAYESAPIAVSFVVNLTRTLTMPIFNDVISIVDTCHCIDHSSVKWYHNGVYVGDGPYYQEVGGLTGGYHVQLSMNGQTRVTCEQTDLTTIVSEVADTPATVSVYPNPAVDRVTVSIDHSATDSHTLRVMNVMGKTLVDTTFDGDATEIDFSGFGIGSYNVSVDGVVVRVIKK